MFSCREQSNCESFIKTPNTKRTMRKKRTRESEFPFCLEHQNAYEYGMRCINFYLLTIICIWVPCKCSVQCDVFLCRSVSMASPTLVALLEICARYFVCKKNFNNWCRSQFSFSLSLHRRHAVACHISFSFLSTFRLALALWIFPNELGLIRMLKLCSHKIQMEN